MEKAEKVQYDLEGAVLKSEQPRWPYKQLLVVVLLVFVIVGSALGLIVFQRYYLREVKVEVDKMTLSLEKMDEVNTEKIITIEEGDEAETENYLREVNFEAHEQYYTAEEIKQMIDRWDLQQASEVEPNEKTGTAEFNNENPNTDDKEEESAKAEDQYVTQKETAEEMPTSEAQSNVSSISEAVLTIVDSEESEKLETEKSTSVKRIEPETTFFDRLFNPFFNDFGAGITVVELKIDADGGSFKYGENEGRLKEVTKNNDSKAITELILLEIGALAEQSNDPSVMLDFPELHGEMEEIFIHGCAFKVKLHFEDGQWSLASATLTEKETAEGDSIASDNKEKLENAVADLDDLFRRILHSDGKAINEEYEAHKEAEQQEGVSSSGSLEKSEPKTIFINGFFNPLNDFGSDVAVLELKIDSAGAYFKYGENEDSMKELAQNDVVPVMAGLILVDIADLAQQANNSGRKIDFSALNDESDEIFNFFQGNEFQAKLRFEDGRWSLESVTVTEEKKQVEAENPATSDDEEKSDSAVTDSGHLLSLDSNEEENSEEYAPHEDTEEQKDSKPIGEVQSSVLSTSESPLTSGDWEESDDPDTDKSVSVETNENVSPFLNTIFNPLGDFGAESTEFSQRSNVRSKNDVILSDITALAKQPDSSDPKMDISALNGEVEEFFNASFGNEFEVKLRFKKSAEITSENEEISDPKATFLARFFDPLDDFGADEAVLEFKIDIYGTSLKYGANEDSLTDLSESSGWLGRVILPEITALAKQSDGSDRKKAIPALNNIVEEIVSISLGNEFEAKLRFEDGRWSVASATVTEKKKNNKGIPIGKEQGSISSTSESNLTTDGSGDSEETEKRAHDIPLLDRFFNPYVKLRADVAVIEFKLNTDEASFKYGESEASLKELIQDESISVMTGLIIPEIAVLVKQAYDSGRKLDVPVLNGVMKENSSFSLGSNFEVKLRFEDGQWSVESATVREKKEHNKDIPIDEQLGSISSSRESNLATDGSEETKKSANVEKSKPDISLLDRFFNPLVNFKADVAVIEFKLDTDEASFKYGENEANLKEMIQDEGIPMKAGLIMPEIADLVKQASDSGRKLDVPALNDVMKENSSFSLGGNFEVKLRFENGRWSVESATVREKKEHNKDTPIDEEQGSISPSRESNLATDGLEETKKSASVEVSKPDISLLDRFFNPLVNLKADVAVIEFKLDTDEASFKYGENEASLKEMIQDEGIPMKAGLIMPEIADLVKQASDSGRKLDVPALNGEKKENSSFSLGSNFEIKLRFEDGQWSVESATVREKKEHNKDIPIDEQLGSISSSRESNLATDGLEETKKPANVEVSKPDISLLDRFFNPLVDLKSDVAVIDFKLDTDEASFKYGENEASLKELIYDEYVPMKASLIMPEIADLVKQAYDSGRKLDVPALNGEMEENSSFSLGSNFEVKLRFENGRWSVESATIREKKEQNKDIPIGEEQSSISSLRESNLAEETKKSANVEVSKPDISLLDRFFNPLVDLKADVAVIEFKLDTDEASFKYGENEASLKEMIQDEYVPMKAGLIMPEIAELVKQAYDSGRKLDVPALNGVMKENSSFSLGSNFKVKLRFEDGRWSVESATVKEQTGLAKAESSSNQEKDKSVDSDAQSNLEEQSNEQLETRNETEEHNESKPVGDDASSDPWVELGASFAALNIKIDSNGPSLKYGQDDFDLRKFNKKSFLMWMDVIFQKIISLAEQLNAGLFEEIDYLKNKWNLFGSEKFEARLRFKVDRWMLELIDLQRSAENTEPLEAENEDQFPDIEEESSLADAKLENLFSRILAEAKSNADTNNEHESIPADDFEMDGRGNEEAQNESAKDGSISSTSDLPVANGQMS